MNICLTEKYGATTLSNAEVFGIGESLLSWMSAVTRLGHSSPASTLDYTKDPWNVDSPFPLIVRDFVAWTSGREELAPGCEERLRSLVECADLDRHASSSIGKRLLLAANPPGHAEA
jgi:hypothetical protein